MLVVLVGAAGLATRGAGERTLDLGGGPSPTPLLVPTFLPGGCRLRSALTQPPTPDAVATRTYSVDIYARADPSRSVDERIARDSFSVTLGRVGPPSRATRSSYAAADADLWEGAGGMRFAMNHDKISDRDPYLFSVWSRSLSDAQLTETFTSIRVLDQGTIDPTSIPSGYERVASDADTAYLGYASAHFLTAPGYTFLYADCEPGGGNLTVTVQRAGPDSLTALRWALGSPATTIRGRPATMGTGTLPRRSGSGAQAEPGSTATALGWLEDAGTLVTVDSPVVDASTLARVAEGLRDDRDAWNAVVAAGGGTDGGSTGPTVPTSTP
jgi:hypothetical protein